VRRLLIINAFIACYFLFQSVTIIYLAIDRGHQSVAFDLVHLSVNALCLVVIVWMYRASVRHLLKEDVLKSNTAKSKSNVLSASSGQSETSRTRSGGARHAVSPRRFTQTMTAALKKRMSTAALSREPTQTITEVAGAGSPRLPVYPSSRLSSRKPAVEMARSVTPCNFSEQSAIGTPTVKSEASRTATALTMAHALSNRRASISLQRDVDSNGVRPSSVDPDMNGVHILYYDESQQPPPGQSVAALTSSDTARTSLSPQDKMLVARKLSKLMLGDKRPRAPSAMEKAASHSLEEDAGGHHHHDALPEAAGPTAGGATNHGMHSEGEEGVEMVYDDDEQPGFSDHSSYHF